MKPNPAAWLLGTWFGCGCSPLAPGTVGSAGALAVACGAAALTGWSRAELAWAVAILLGPAVWAAGRVASASGSKDPGHVVVDEVIGQWITLCGAARYSVRSVVLAFCLFRLFDIWKPWPVRRLESLPGGKGIVADDVAAGVLGALVLALAGWLNLY